jgi:hypothetical protein
VAVRGVSVAFHTPVLWAIGCIVMLAIRGLADIVIADAFTDRLHAMSLIWQQRTCYERDGLWDLRNGNQD